MEYFRRLDCVGTTGEHEKANQAFKYPLTLDMEPFLNGEAWTGSAHESQVRSSPSVIWTQVLTNTLSLSNNIFYIVPFYYPMLTVLSQTYLPRMAIIGTTAESTVRFRNKLLQYTIVANILL